MERREFIKLSLTRRRRPEPRLLPAGGPRGGRCVDPAFAPNAWLRIDPDNRITFICPQNEMGQDVHTSLAVLVAEELDVPVGQPGDRAGPRGPRRTRTRCWAASSPAARPPSATPGCPCARPAPRPAALFIAAAAKTWQVDAATLGTDAGHVTGPGGKRLSYGALAATAATLPAPALDKVRLKAPASFTQIGKAGQKRLDTPAKLRGERLFGIDAKQPGMVHAALAQCPVIGGTVVSVDDSKARAMPGRAGRHQHGDGVAVVADHFWTAKKARDALEVKWLVGAAGSVSSESVARALETGTRQAGADRPGERRCGGRPAAGEQDASKPGTNCRCWPTWPSSR